MYYNSSTKRPHCWSFKRYPRRGRQPCAPLLNAYPPPKNATNEADYSQANATTQPASFDFSASIKALVKSDLSTQA